MQGTLQNCQGGTLQTNGTKRAELLAVTTEGEEILLQHDFIVGNVTSCLVSLGQLYQGGWSIHKNKSDDSLSLLSPGNEVKIPIEYRNRSFAIRAHVRQVSDMASTCNVVAGDNGELTVRTVVYAGDEIEDTALDEWGMTADGTPFLRKLTTDYVDPTGVWPFWPYRTTLIRKFQKDKPWKVVELSRKFSDMRNPYGMIDQFLLTIGFEDECESLTLLGVETQTLLDLGLVVVDEAGDVVFGQDEFEVSGLRDELPATTAQSSSGSQVPAVLPPEGVVPMHASGEVEPGDEIEAVPKVGAIRSRFIDHP